MNEYINTDLVTCRRTLHSQTISFYAAGDEYSRKDVISEVFGCFSNPNWNDMWLTGKFASVGKQYSTLFPSITQ